jgi:alpha-glucosidase (family GH31 glycosyl hydrolase)
MIRPLPGQLYEYMLGDEILVAPVFRKGETLRELFVPEGRWVNYWTGELLEGGRYHKIPAPIRHIPLLVRQGAIIPERQYASSIEKGTNDTLAIHVFPGADRNFRLIEDDGLSNDYVDGIFALTEITSRSVEGSLTVTIRPVRGEYEGMTSERFINMVVHCREKPSGVLVNGRAVHFDYDPLKMQSFISAGTADKRKETVLKILYK